MKVKFNFFVSMFCCILMISSSYGVQSQVDATNSLVPKLSMTIGSDGYDYVTLFDRDQQNNSYLTGYFSYPIYNVNGPHSFYPGPFYDINKDVFKEYPVVGEGKHVHYSGGNEIPLTKINNEGKIQYSEYFGGNGSEVANDIAPLNDGRTVVVGYTGSVSFASYGSIGNKGSTDGLIMIIDANGGIETLKTIGGSGFDQISAVSILSDGSIIVAGSTGSTDFPLVNSFQNASRLADNNSDIFVAKYDKLMNLEFSTIIGGSSIDRVSKMIIDQNNDIFVAGFTLGDDFPMVNGIYDHSFGTTDIILLKLNQNGPILQ